MKLLPIKVALVLLATVPFWAQSALAADVGEFVSIADDLPLLEGLVEDPDQALAFDKPDGRIAEALACGEGDPKMFLKAYAETLPSLGWEKKGKAWLRDGDKLTLTIEDAIDVSCIRFRVTPR